MSATKRIQQTPRFGLAGQWFDVIIKCITARFSTSKDARASLSFLGESSYRKPHLTLTQQVAHLRAKGMLIVDDAWVQSRLAQVGYYRLSAYWHPFKERRGPMTKDSERLRVGTKFEDIHALYEYDRKLRQLVLAGIEMIEVSLRVNLAYQLGQKDCFAYMRPALLSPRFSKPDVNGESDYFRWHQGYQQKVHRPNEDFTKHLLSKYGQPLPIWAAVELWEFNQLGFFLGGLRHEDALIIAAKYGLSSPKMFLSWVKAVKGLRNHAAHHGRIWNRNMTAQPILPALGLFPELDFIIEDPSKIRQARVGCPLILMACMIRKLDSSSNWPEELRQFIAKFPVETGMSIEQMGFSPNWPK